MLYIEDYELAEKYQEELRLLLVSGWWIIDLRLEKQLKNGDTHIQLFGEEFIKSVKNYFLNCIGALWNR